MSSTISHHPRRLSLEDLPPALAAHVAACKTRGLDLLPWVDPYRDVPRRPLFDLLDRFIEEYSGRPSSRTGKPPAKNTTRQLRRSIQRIIEAADFWEPSDLNVRAVAWYAGSLARRKGFYDRDSNAWLRRILANAFRFVEWLRACGRLKQDSLQDWTVDECIQFEYKLRTGRKVTDKRRAEVEALLDAGRPKRAIARATGLGLATVKRIAGSRTTNGRDAKANPSTSAFLDGRKSWDYLEDYDNWRKPTYHNLDALLDESELPRATPEERAKSKSKLCDTIKYLRAVRDQALTTDGHNPQLVGRPELLEDLCFLWHTTVGAPTEGSIARICDRLNRFPRKVMVAIAGGNQRYARRLPPGSPGCAAVRHLLKKAKERHDPKPIPPKRSTYNRRHWTLRTVEKRERTEEQVLLYYDADVRRRIEICPENPAPFDHIKRVKADLTLARKERESQPHFAPRFKRDEGRDLALFELLRETSEDFSNEKNTDAWRQLQSNPEHKACKEAARRYNAQPDCPCTVSPRSVGVAAFRVWCERNPVEAVPILKERPYWARDHMWGHWAQGADLTPGESLNGYVLDRHNALSDEELGALTVVRPTARPGMGGTQTWEVKRIPDERGQRARALGRIAKALRRAEWEEGIERRAQELLQKAGAPPEQAGPPDGQVDGSDATGTEAAERSQCGGDKGTPGNPVGDEVKPKGMRKRGPKGSRTDTKADKAIWDAWQTGCWKTKGELAAAKELREKHVKDAIERVRKRLSRMSQT